MAAEGHGGWRRRPLWSWPQVMVVEQENQGRSGAILIEGVLFMLHFEWDFPNVNDS
jgi:hypothetical protein